MLISGVDMSELALPSTMRTFFPDPDDILNFTLTLEPDEGLFLSTSVGVVVTDVVWGA